MEALQNASGGTIAFAIVLLIVVGVIVYSMTRRKPDEEDEKPWVPPPIAQPKPRSPLDDEPEQPQQPQDTGGGTKPTLPP